MVEFKVGQEVTVNSRPLRGTISDEPEIIGKKMTITHLSKIGNGWFDYVTDATERGRGTVFSDDYHRVIEFKENKMKFNVNDIIVDDDGDYRKIIAIVGTKYAASEYGDKDFAESETEATDLWDEEESSEWTLAGEEVKELTLQEVADKFGIDVSAVRIKE